MSRQTHYFRIGLFVIASFLLAVIAIVLLSSKALTEHSVMIETYINESVKGLDIGSPVKLRGVKIGQVSQITFVNEVYTTSNRYVLVRVNLPLDKETKETEQDLKKSIEHEVAQGLRVRLTSQGVTGVAYLEADYVDISRYPPLPIDWKPAHIYVPSAPSVITLLSDSLEKILNKLEGIHIQQVMTNLDRLIVDIDRVIAQDLSPAVQSIHLASSNTAMMLRDTSMMIRSVMSNSVNPLLENVKTSTESLPDSMTRLNQAIFRLDALLADQQEGMTETMINLRAMTENLEDLTDHARDYPSMILFGEPPPKVDLSK